jgi:hypothetical protein
MNLISLSVSFSATFFFQNGNAGACGKVHSDEDFIVALFTSVYDNGKYCGKQVKITNVQSGTSQVATVAGANIYSFPFPNLYILTYPGVNVDECPTCKGASVRRLSPFRLFYYS